MQIPRWARDDNCGGMKLLISRGSLKRRHNLFDRWHVELLQRRGEGNRRHIGCSHAHDRCVEAIEGLFRDDGGNFGANTQRAMVLMHDYAAVGFSYRFQKSI